MEKLSYVYVYIDPRNFQEFYYGKGINDRKLEHLKEKGDSKKNIRINEILNEGLSPIIKVIARNLTEEQALLVEKTLIWKLGKNLDNISTGHFSENFRPHNTFHKNLEGFDYKNGIYNVNIGEDEHRCWEDSRKYGFISAGQGIKYSKQIQSLEKNDIVAAYLSGYGYVGIGKIIEKSVKINEFLVNNEPLRNFNLVQPNIFKNCNNKDSEYLLKIEWLKSVNKNDAKWKTNCGLYSTQLIKSSLTGQPKTIKFLETEFDINFKELLIKNNVL